MNRKLILVLAGIIITIAGCGVIKERRSCNTETIEVSDLLSDVPLQGDGWKVESTMIPNQSSQELESRLAIVMDIPGTIALKFDVLPETEFFLGLGVIPKSPKTAFGTSIRISYLDKSGAVREMMTEEINPFQKSEHRCWVDIPVRVETDNLQGMTLLVEAKAEALKEGDSVEAIGAQIAIAPLSLLSSRSSAVPGNIYLIIMDTLRGDHLGCWGSSLSLSPNLDKFSREAVLFNQTYSHCNWTLPSIASILSGKVPQNAVIQTGDYEAIRPGVKLISNYLQKAGFITSAVVNNPNLSSQLGFAEGFQIHRYILAPLDMNTRQSANTKAQVVTDRAKDLLFKIRNQPHFMMVHYMDPHFPYGAAEPFGKLAYREALPNTMGWIYQKATALEKTDVELGIEEPEKQHVRRLYAGEIMSTDSAFGQFINELHEQKLFDTSLIIVTADHGEEFWEHGNLAHEWSLYNELLHVPLLVKFPKDLHGGTLINDLTALSDIAPGILDYIGEPFPGGMDGVNLLDTLPSDKNRSRNHIMSHNDKKDIDSIQTAHWKWIRSNLQSTEELYHLESDPGERVNVITQYPEVISAFQRQMQQAKSADTVPGATESGSRGDEMLSEDLRRSLEALGYIK